MILDQDILLSLRNVETALFINAVCKNATCLSGGLYGWKPCKVYLKIREVAITLVSTGSQPLDSLVWNFTAMTVLCKLVHNVNINFDDFVLQ